MAAELKALQSTLAAAASGRDTATADAAEAKAAAALVERFDIEPFSDFSAN